jgi:uncharacterized protein HemY
VITDRQIDRLRDEAALAGDRTLVSLCRVALHVDRGDADAARRQVEEVLIEREEKGQ